MRRRISGALWNKSGCLIVGTLITNAAAGPPPPPPMVVIVDMDATTPGSQSTVNVSACNDQVNDIAIHIYDPYQAHAVWSIGYFGGIDRGIAFGHTIDNANNGAVTHITGTPGTPVNPGNTPWVTPGFIPEFDGGEIHYLENGAGQRALVSPWPTPPVCTVSVTLSNAHPGDQFRFYLLDYVSVWTGGTNGAFSVSSGTNSLDAGGDCVPDQTMTAKGVDPDVPVPSPPAPFFVDFVDGPTLGGGAVINILPKPGDITGDNVTGVPDLLSVINEWGPCSASPVIGDCPADLNGDGQVGVGDLQTVINNWGDCGNAPTF